MKVIGFTFTVTKTTEPPHIHIDKQNSSAKFWLDSISLARNIGYSAKELRRIQEIVTEKQKYFLEKWYGYFSKPSR